MTDPFAPVEPGPQGGSPVPTASSAPFSHTVSTPPPAVIAPTKKGDRTFTILLAVGLLIAVGGVAFAVGRVTAPAQAASTRGGFGAGGFGAGGTGAAGAGAARGGFGGVLLTGTVDSISGTTMTLKEANGTTVIVNLASTTTYHAQAPATAADVTTGKQVQVQITGGLGGGAGAAGGATGGTGATGGGAAGASPAAGGGAGTTTRTVTASEVTLVTP